MDSVHRFDYKIEGDGNKRIMIMKAGKDDDHMIMAPFPPDVPKPPYAPKVMMLRGQKNKNVIDLSDPGIISYDKKLRKDGTEKITIVRKQLIENDSLLEDVFTRDDGEVIHVKEINKDGEKQIEVKVEKKTEKENK